MSSAADIHPLAAASARPSGRVAGGRPYAPVVAAAACVSLVSLIPLGFIVWVAIQTGWTRIVELVFRPRIGELLVNTALLELFTVPIAIVLAVALAWLIERTDLPGHRWWSALAVAPLAIPAFVHSYGWVNAVPSLHGLPAAVLISVLAYFPFIYLPVAAQLRRLDPSVEDAAASLGKTPRQVFLQVVVPQLRLAVLAGSLLVGLHLLAEYGLYAMIRFDTFSTGIVDVYQSAYNSPAANMMGGVLLLCCFLLLGADSWLRGGERYARVGPGAQRPPIRRSLGALALPLMALPLVTAILSLGVPLATVARWLTFGGARVWPVADIASAFVQTLALAVAGGLLATLAAAPAAWLAVRAPSRLQRLFEAGHYYVGSLPGVIVALALVTVTVRLVFPLYQSYATLLLAYVMLFLPRAMAGLRASLAQAPLELEQAAMALGKSPFAAVRRITFPLAAPGAAASVALVALGITNELTATLMLSPNGTRTLATEFWAMTAELDYAAAAPYAAMMIVLSLPLSLALHSQSERFAGQ
ncbi:MAG TPA: iron ABC transporter permease [Mesorhizobium sp.]